LPLYLPWCLRLGTAMGPLTPQLVRPQSDDIHRLRDFGRGAADAGFVPKRGDTLVTGFRGVPQMLGSVPKRRHTSVTEFVGGGS
jgi:hypothetical protein